MFDLLLLFLMFTTDSTWTVVPGLQLGQQLGFGLLELYLVYMVAVFFMTIVCYKATSLLMRYFHIKEWRGARDLKEKMGKLGIFAGLLAAVFLTWDWVVAIGAAMLGINLGYLLTAVAIDATFFFVLITGVGIGVSMIGPDPYLQIFATIGISLLISFMLVQMLRRSGKI
jgi:hypothetical protein